MTHFNDHSAPDRARSQELTESLVDRKRIYRLIDDILPLELCLHYEILPLELNNDRLIVGMVNLEDEHALNSILPIVTTLGYTLSPKLLDSQTHQQILASYLKKPNSAEAPRDRRRADFAQTVVGRPDEIPDLPRDRRRADFAQTVVGRPDELDLPGDRQPSNAVDKPNTKIGKLATDRSMTLTEIPSDFDSVNLIEENTKERQSVPQSKSTSKSSTPFANEPPRQLWRKLYNRLLNGKITQLGLKSDHNFCQIADCQPSESELAWKPIEPSVFTAVANEIKALVKLPPLPLKEPKKVALEKLRDRERVLLRIEFIPTPQGEEILIKAMRGDTLLSYEQKQIDKISEQALFLALKLENTLNKLRLSSNRAKPKNLVALKTAITEIERQLELIEE